MTLRSLALGLSLAALATGVMAQEVSTTFSSPLGPQTPSASLSTVPAANPVGYGSWGGAPVSVTGTSGSPTLIVAARTGVAGTGRGQVTIVNNTASPAVLTLCPTSSCTTGHQLIAVAGANVTLYTTAAVYGFSTATQSISYFEVY